MVVRTRHMGMPPANEAVQLKLLQTLAAAASAIVHFSPLCCKESVNSDKRFSVTLNDLCCAHNLRREF